MSEYSMKMQEVFSIAQYQAARFESPYLESWHVLLAMVAVHDSVAGLTFAEYQIRLLTKSTKRRLFWRSENHLWQM